MRGREDNRERERENRASAGPCGEFSRVHGEFSRVRVHAYAHACMRMHAHACARLLQSFRAGTRAVKGISRTGVTKGIKKTTSRSEG